MKNHIKWIFYVPVEKFFTTSSDKLKREIDVNGKKKKIYIYRRVFVAAHPGRSLFVNPWFIQSSQCMSLVNREAFLYLLLWHSLTDISVRYNVLINFHWDLRARSTDNWVSRVPALRTGWSRLDSLQVRKYFSSPSHPNWALGLPKSPQDSSSETENVSHMSSCHLRIDNKFTV
jgi:hypothetical protein